MKKQFTTMCAMILSFAMLTACGRVDPETGTTYTATADNPESDAELFKYRQVTPDSEIVKGDATALATIENYLGKAPSTVEDKYIPAISSVMESHPVYGSLGNDKDVYLRYEVMDYPENYSEIIFLYWDDKKVITTHSNEEVIKDEKVDQSRFDGDGVTWQRENGTCAVLTEKAGFRCTSIWAYDATENSIACVWADTFNCPIWQDFDEE